MRIPPDRLRPRSSQRFAKGLGRRAKTDPIDAQSLYDSGRVVMPKADTAPSAAQSALQELVVARQQAVLERSTVTRQAAGHQTALVKALCRARLKLLSAQIAKLEAAIAKTLAAVMRKLFLLLNHLLKNPTFQLAA